MSAATERDPATASASGSVTDSAGEAAVPSASPVDPSELPSGAFLTEAQWGDADDSRKQPVETDDTDEADTLIIKRASETEEKQDDSALPLPAAEEKSNNPRDQQLVVRVSPSPSANS